MTSRSPSSAASVPAPDSAPIRRPAGRVLLVDERDRVLLLHGWDPGRERVQYWFTVGGGVDPGETVRQAAARELYEEPVSGSRRRRSASRCGTR